jgi:hypothetical protein
MPTSPVARRKSGSSQWVILEVWSFGAAGPVIDLAIELHTYATCCGSEAHAASHTYTEVTLHESWIELVPEKPWHVDPDKFKPTTPPGVEPSVPWGVKRRAYRWDGSRLSAKDER